jgi:CheY-like chemotaxis protein
VKSKLLVVDDSELALCLFAQFFEDEGLIVFQASNGEHAVQLATAHSMCAVLTDIEMPVMNGIVASRCLRSMSGYSSTPIFAFTGVPIASDVDRALFTAVLIKPMTPREVFTVIKPYLLAHANGS